MFWRKWTNKKVEAPPQPKLCQWCQRPMIAVFDAQVCRGEETDGAVWACHWCDTPSHEYPFWVPWGWSTEHHE